MIQSEAQLEQQFLDKLKEMGYIERSGGKTFGHWDITEKKY